MDICADRGGHPPIIASVGPTGSGKGETVRLAASFLDDDRLTLALLSNEEQTWRRIGSAVEAGHRFLAVDEFLRRGNTLSDLVGYVLQLSSVITWRRLYTNRDVQTVTRSAFFLSAGCVPDGFKKSPEIRRRMWLARLFRQVPEWSRSCGGDTTEWRGRSKRNGLIANSILTRAYRLCVAHDFEFDAVAVAIDLCRIDEGEAELQRELLRDLYRHCRNESGDRVLHTASRYRSGRWVDALSGACQELLQQLVPDEDTDRLDAAGMVFQLQQNLQMVPWNKVLDIESPPIMCEMRRHNAKVAIRFRETGGSLRGRERINEDLPPMPDADDSGGSPGRDEEPDPRDGGGGPLCRLCPEDGHNGNPADGLESTKNGSVEHRSAGYARYAYSLQKTVGTREEKETGSRESGGVSPKTLAQRLTQRQPAATATLHDQAAAALSFAGFPQQLLVLDFETYFDRGFSLKKLTVPAYVHDARFHVHGVAVRRPDGSCEFRIDVEAALAEIRAAYGDDLATVATVAHNLHFDGYILAKKYGLRPCYLVDTLALARHVFPRMENSLAALAERLGLQPKGDVLKELDGVRELSSVQAANLAAYAKRDAELCHDIAIRLLPLVSRPGVEIRLIDHTTRLFTEKGLPFDMVAARQLLEQADDELKSTLDAAGIDRKTAGGSQLEQLLADELAKDDQKLPVKPGKNGNIAALAKGDAGMKGLLKHDNPRVRRLAEARLAVKSAPQVQNRLRTLIDIADAIGGMLPISLKYAGAHTGRYSGDGGINFQNLPAHVKGLAGQIRGLLLAGDGHKLVIVDAAQIEARVLAWLAGQQDSVETFARGEDVYSSFASQVFGEEVRKPAEDATEAMKAEYSTRQRLGKVAVLGLGYQMGAERFIQGARADPELAKMLADGSLTEAFLTEVHRAYRTTYSRISSLWYDVQAAFRNALQQGQGTAAGIEFTRDTSAVYAQLPSGRKLVYHEPDVSLSNDMQYIGGKLYGGLLVENLVQAMSRDILVEAILTLEDLGHPVVLTVHDEVVLRVPNNHAEQALCDAKRCLSTTPDWAAGLPLAAEGNVAERYGK